MPPSHRPRATAIAKGGPKPTSRTEKRLRQRAREGFIRHKDGIACYTDASALIIGPAPAGTKHKGKKDNKKRKLKGPGRPMRAGVGRYWGKGERPNDLNASEPVPGPDLQYDTNRAETWGVIRSIEDHPDPLVPLYVLTDSKYAVNFFKKYAQQRPPNLKTHKNADLIKRLLRAMDRLSCKVSVSWVRGHSGIFGNEAADRLAKKAALGDLTAAVHWVDSDSEADDDSDGKYDSDEDPRPFKRLPTATSSRLSSDSEDEDDFEITGDNLSSSIIDLTADSDSDEEDSNADDES